MSRDVPIPEGADDVDRIERIERALAVSGLHAPGCPGAHDCSRDHPGADVYHAPQPCVCWLGDIRRELSDSDERPSG